MASIKISQLNKLNQVTSDDFVPVVDSGSLTTYFTPVSALAGFMGTSGAALSASWASRSLVCYGTASYATKLAKTERFVRNLSTTPGNAVTVCNIYGWAYLVHLAVSGLHCSCDKTYIVGIQYISPGLGPPFSPSPHGVPPGGYNGWFTVKPLVSPMEYPWQDGIYTDFDLEASQSQIHGIALRIRTTNNDVGTATPTASLQVWALNPSSAIITDNGSTEVVSSNDLPAWGSAFATFQGNYRFVISGSTTSTNGFTGSLVGTASRAVSSSWANTSSMAVTASYVVTTGAGASVPDTASYAKSSSWADTASFSRMGITASYAISASNIPSSLTASYALTASVVIPSTAREYAVKSVFAQQEEIGCQPITYQFLPWLDIRERINYIGTDVWGTSGTGMRLATDVCWDQPQFPAFSELVVGGSIVSKIYAMGLNMWTLMKDGTVYSSGYGAWGQLGQNSVANSPLLQPINHTNINLVSGQKVTGLRPAGGRDVWTGYGTVAFLTDQNNVYLCGNIDYYYSAPRKYLSPTIYDSASLSGNCVDAMVNGAADPAFYFLKSDGSVIGFGRGASYEMGQGAGTNTWVSSDTPAHVGGYLPGPVTVWDPANYGGRKVAKMYCSSGQPNHASYYDWRMTTMFLTDTGHLYMFGGNERGQCAVDPLLGATPYYVTVPTFVSALAAKTITSGSCGGSYGRWQAGALDVDGYIYLWGDNYFGNLGYTTPLGYSFTPTTPTVLVGIRFKKLVFQNNGRASTYALTRDGRLFVCGDNVRGQLGTGDEYGTTISTFKEIAYPANIKHHIVDVGIHSNCTEYRPGIPNDFGATWLLTDEGDLYAAGDNQGCQVGFERYSNWSGRGFGYDLSRVFRRVNRPV